MCEVTPSAGHSSTALIRPSDATDAHARSCICTFEQREGVASEGSSRWWWDRDSGEKIRRQHCRWCFTLFLIVISDFGRCCHPSIYWRYICVHNQFDSLSSTLSPVVRFGVRVYFILSARPKLLSTSIIRVLTRELGQPFAGKQPVILPVSILTACLTPSVSVAFIHLATNSTRLCPLQSPFSPGCIVVGSERRCMGQIFDRNCDISRFLSDRSATLGFLFRASGLL